MQLIKNYRKLSIVNNQFTANILQNHLFKLTLHILKKIKKSLPSKTKHPKKQQL